MKTIWSGLILVGLMAGSGARAEHPGPGQPAPAPVLRTGTGDGYKFLSTLYHTGPSRPGDRRSAVVLLFIGPEDEATRQAMSALSTVARRMHDHAGLRGKARFFVVETGQGEGRGTLMDRLAHHQVGLPVDALLDLRGEACRAFGIEVLPQMVVVSRTGVLTASLAAQEAGSLQSVARAVVNAVKETGRSPAAKRPDAGSRMPAPVKGTADFSQPVSW